jgi:hypothetical protein
MALELNLAASYVNEDGSIITVSDTTNWGIGVRNNYALFLVPSIDTGRGDVNLQVIKEPAELSPADVTSWKVPSDVDGKYTFELFAFELFVSETPEIGNEGKIYYNKTEDSFHKWDGVDFTVISFAQAQESILSVPAILVIPVLFKARTFKTKLVLKYVKDIKEMDLSHRDKNRLYYERSELDHFNALLLAAEYSFSISIFTNFYEIIDLLKELIIANTDYDEL